MAVKPTIVSRRKFLTMSSAAVALAWKPLGAVARPYRWTPAAGDATMPDTATVRGLRARVRGSVIFPGDAAYDRARRIYNRRFDRHPAMIVQCADTEDVVRAVDFARRNSLITCVRSGGHDHAGYSSCDNAMVIDLAKLNAIHVDLRRRTAHVGAGVEVGQLYHALQAHALTTTSGTCPSVGVAGLTLGGGVGKLSCKYGLACDNVLSAQIVTADGRVLTASSEENPDLFWAIRGGGGNFGVVTRFEFRLFAIERVLTGEITYPISQSAEVLRRYREFVASAPDALSTSAAFFPSDDKAFTISFCYTGDLGEGERAAKPLNSLGRPLDVSVTAVPPIAALLGEGKPADTCALETGAFFPHLSDSLIGVLYEHLNSAPSAFEVGINDLHGAALKGDSAFPLRTPGFETYITAQWTRELDSQAAIDWVNQLSRDLRPFTGGVYVNRLHEEGGERAREAYGANYDRLAAIKAKYDPMNFFRMNQNIQPAIPPCPPKSSWSRDHRALGDR